jgi:large subunit ribosomal protein L21
MYAIVKSGSKQYRVLEGDVFRVEKIDALVGDQVELNDVAMLVKDDGIVVDPAKLASAKVVCQIVGAGRARKVLVFKKKRKKNYTRLRGHRQCYTMLKVAQIVG